jgi:hypothetical protein
MISIPSILTCNSFAHTRRSSVPCSQTALRRLERVVLLPEVEVETFQVFERWLSNLKLSEYKDLDWPFDRRPPVFEDLDWLLLYKFFFLTDYLQALSAQKPLLQALASKLDKNRVVLLSLIPVIYENTLPGSPLRQLWIG